MKAARHDHAEPPLLNAIHQQIGWVTHFHWGVLPFLHLATVFSFLPAVGLTFHMLSQRRPPSSTLAWLLVMVLLPYVGVPLYVLLGRRKLPSRRALEPAGDLTSATSPIDRVLRSIGMPRALGGNSLELLDTGTGAFEGLIESIRAATRSIHIETFILGGDDAGNAVLDLLTQRAQDGLEVALLRDGLFSRLSDGRRLAALRGAGGHTAVFTPLVHRPFKGGGNLRLHRKITLIDGREAVIGGMNIAHEYMGPAPDAARWRDLNVRLIGPTAAQLDDIFRKDWAFASDEPLAPRVAYPASAEGGTTLHVVESGPESPIDTFYEAILTGVFAASRRIWLATPYFVPDIALERGLEIAVRRGVDVRLFVPEHSNHFLSDIAGGSSLRLLAHAGAKVRPYLPGMLHAKAALMDDWAILGSANLNARSFFLDHEVAIAFSQTEDTRRLEQWFHELEKQCAESLAPPSRFRRFAEAGGRLFAALV